MREFHRSNKGVVLNTHLMVVFITLFQTSHNGNGCRWRRLIDHHHLESPLQSLVRLKVFLILIQGRRTDGPEFASRKSRFEYIGSIHRSGRTPRPDKSVYLVYKEDNLSLAVYNLLDNTFETFLKLALIFRTCDQCSQIEGIYLAAFQIFRYISIHNLLSDTLGYGRLADTRLAHQYRIVLSTPAEYLQYSSYLLITAYHRIEFALRRPLIEIDSEPAQIF